MNIKQAEEASGIQKRNIRFYEKEGLISPKRNENNDYRDYSEEDVQMLKMIRMLRMIDMPLEQIKDIIDGNMTMEEAMAKQNSLNVENFLKKMDQPENQNGLFKQWLEDYKKVAKTELQKSFIFYPDIAIQTPSDFTLALCKYANEQNLNLVITKEGMYPQFTIDGVEYEADRYYRSMQRVPVSVIRCKMLYPELYEPEMPKARKGFMKVLHHSWLLILFLILCIPTWAGFPLKDLFHTWEGRVILLAGIVIAGVEVYFYKIFHYNEKH